MIVPKSQPFPLSLSMSPKIHIGKPTPDVYFQIIMLLLYSSQTDSLIVLLVLLRTYLKNTELFKPFYSRMLATNQELSIKLEPF
jgi:hypothetical protein